MVCSKMNGFETFLEIFTCPSAHRVSKMCATECANTKATDTKKILFIEYLFARYVWMAKVCGSIYKRALGTCVCSSHVLVVAISRRAAPCL
jgi:hypothetical protein